jgi:hypothetical protein
MNHLKLSSLKQLQQHSSGSSINNLHKIGATVTFLLSIASGELDGLMQTLPRCGTSYSWRVDAALC